MDALSGMMQRDRDELERPFTVEADADETNHSGFGDALARLARHAEFGRPARITAPGGLVLASTAGDRTIRVA